MSGERLFEVGHSSPVTCEVNRRVLTPQVSFVHDASTHQYTPNLEPGLTLNQMDPRRPQGETVTRNNYSANLHADFEVTFTRTYGLRPCLPRELHVDGQTDRLPSYY